MSYDVKSTPSALTNSISDRLAAATAAGAAAAGGLNTSASSASTGAGTALRTPAPNTPSGSDKDSKNEEEEKYIVRPTYKDMFKPQIVQNILKTVLKAELTNKTYDQYETGNWTKKIAVAIKAKLKELDLKRYKFLVQVVIGENKGAGVRMGCRCLWDSQTDKVAQETFMNDSLFCVAVAFGVYLY